MLPLTAQEGGLCSEDRPLKSIPLVPLAFAASALALVCAEIEVDLLLRPVLTAKPAKLRSF
jgi:hypothetical protein